MGYIYKLKPEIIKFIVNYKQKFIDISCRKLALEVSKKYAIKVSKSSINQILKKENLSCPVGRRSKQILDLEGSVEHGGFCMLMGIDFLLKISKTAAEVLIKLSPSASENLLKDTENTFQALLIFKLIFDVTIDFTKCYNNKEVWSLVGRRPTKPAYNRVIRMIQNSQLFADEVVKEISQRSKPISGFRFQLIDNTSFFVDAGLQTIWQAPVKLSPFFTTYYNANSYINEFIANDIIFSIFNIQETSVFSTDILNFILAFDSQSNSKRIKQIELLDLENNVAEKKLLLGSERRFFLLGFWPWQLDIMFDFEKKAAKQKLIFSDMGVEFYYQIEEFLIPQHLVTQEVKLIALILKNSPLGAARIGILTNIPKDVFPNYLSYKELYHWFLPEERFKDFNKKAKESATRNLSIFPTSIGLSKEKNMDESLDKIFETLSEIIFSQFQNRFLPQGFRSSDSLKIKQIFLRQKAIIKRSKDYIIHNIIINKELCNEVDLRYICQRLNEAGIRDNQDRLLWFQLNR